MKIETKIKLNVIYLSESSSRRDWSQGVFYHRAMESYSFFSALRECLRVLSDKEIKELQGKRKIKF